MNTQNQYLKFCQVNICTLSRKSMIPLDKYTKDNSFDILAVQETKILKPPCISGYNMEHTVPETDKKGEYKIGGCALYIKDKFNNTCRLSQLEKGTKDVIWVLVYIGDVSYIIGTAYIHPEDNEGLENYLKTCKNALDLSNKYHCKGVISLGDFNCRHSLWKDHKINTAGSRLVDFLTDSEFSIISPCMPTFECIGGGTCIIDNIIVTDNLVESAEMNYVDYDHQELATGAPSRGHYPIISMFKVDLYGKSPEHLVKKVYDLKSADWNMWSLILDEEIQKTEQELLEQDSVTAQSIYNMLETSIRRAEETVMKTKILCKHSKPYWTRELSVLSSRIRLARKTFRKNNSIINKQILDQCKDEFTNELSKTINNWTNKGTEKLNTKDSAVFWKEYAKQFKIKDMNTKKIDILINEKGELLTEDEAKANLFYENFFTGHHLKDCTFDEPHKRYIDKQVHEKLHKINNHDSYLDSDNLLEAEDLNSPFTIEELSLALRKIKTSNKCFDGDNIHPLHIKHCGPRFKKWLLRLANNCLENEIWPWNTSKVVMLKKPGKDSYQKPGSYRPISITAYVGKLVERMIESRLRSHFSVDQAIDEEQEGYMPERSTCRYLYRLCAEMNKTKNKKLVGMLLLVDFEKAYDSVWLEGLLYKLQNAGVIGKMWYLIASFLLNRKVGINIGKYTSEYKNSKIGLPQGSVLAPLLFAFYISDMLNGINSAKFKYADDATIYCEAVNKDILLKNIQVEINMVKQWTDKWRFKINCGRNKTELVPVNFQPDEKDTLTLGNTNIDIVETSKVLGVWLDSKLSWKKQISTMRSKVWCQWINIKKLTHHNRGLKMETVVNLVKISVFSTLFYCAPVWLWENTDKFQDLWYDILKKATGSSFKPNQSKLELICNIPPIKIQVKSIIVKFLIKNLINHEEDLFTRSISQYTNINKHFVNQHVQYVKQYIASHEDLRTTYSINLADYESIRYTKTTIWKYIKKEWSQRVNEEFDTGEVFNWSELVTPNTIKTNMPRNLEVFLFGIMHGHLPGNKFLWNLSQVPSPLCDCKTEIETGDHMLFRCIIYQHKRDSIIGNTDPWEFTSVLNKESRKICHFMQKLKELLKYILKHRFNNEIQIKKYMLSYEDN